MKAPDQKRGHLLQTIDTSSKARSWWRPRPPAVQAEVSPEFHQAFVREVLKTERLRMKTLIGAAVILMVLVTTVSWILPSFVEQVWKKQFSLMYLYAIFVPFIVLESITLAVVGWDVDHLHDIPVFRRYLNAFVETSLPTIALGFR